MENTHIENDSNRLPEVDVNLSMSSEMTQCNVGLNSCLEKKKRKRKNQKRRYNSLSRNDRDDNHPEGTLIDITPVQMDLHSPVNTCLSADLEMTPHDAEVILSQEMDKGKEQNKRHNALKSSDTNQELQEHSSWPTHSSTNFKHVEREEDNYISEIAEQLKGFPRCMDASSIKKHDDHAQVDIVSLEVSRNKTQQKKKRVKSNRRKKRKFTDSVTSSLGSIKYVAGFSELVAQDSSVRDTSLNHSEEAPASGYSEKTLGEVVAAHAASLLVAGDILTGKASGECPDGELASGKREKKIKMEHFKEIINEQNGVKGVSGEDPLGKKLEQGNRDKLNVFHNVVQDVYSAKERFDKSLHKEDKPSDDASGSHSSVEKLESDNLEIDPKMKDAISSSSQLGAMTNDVSLAVISKEGPQQMLQSSLGGAATGNFRKKLLVLDVNGLLADIVLYASEGYKPDTVISKKAVFKRPFCDEFLQFCFERFHVGVWSSRTKRNVESILDFLMGKSKCNLLFCWDQSHCTDTGFNTIENIHKPLLLKELKKLWEKHRPDLPWEKGEYNESNTLLLDDSPYKALRNPLHTAIFPYTYQYKDIKDNSLGPNGDLRVYLERLASANNVQKYVEMNPFGQRPITDANISWDFYLKVIGATSSQQEEDANSSSAS